MQKGKGLFWKDRFDTCGRIICVIGFGSFSGAQLR